MQPFLILDTPLRHKYFGLVNTQNYCLYSLDEIIKGCIGGKRLYQKALYDKYCKAMFTLTYRILGDFEMTNESLQDAFISIFKNISGFRGESTIGAWMKTIVVRTAYKHLKNKPDFRNLSLDQLSHEIPLDVYVPLDADYLEKAILSLPDGFRTVFVLIVIEGFTHREVAETLGISEGTSKSQLFHAKKKLQNKINQLQLVNV